jgi:hypothetical protein
MTVVNRTKDAVECQWISIIQTSFKIVFELLEIIEVNSYIILKML